MRHAEAAEYLRGDVDTRMRETEHQDVSPHRTSQRSQTEGERVGRMKSATIDAVQDRNLGLDRDEGEPAGCQVSPYTRCRSVLA